MVNPPSLPLDIGVKILDYLWNDTSALRSCSLVCHAFLPLSQKLIFSDVVVQSRTDSQQLKTLLENSPHLADYVECLKIVDKPADLSGDIIPPPVPEWLSNDTTLSFCLPLFQRLKALAIQYRLKVGSHVYWEGLCNSGLLSSLLDTMSLPSLLYLDLTCVPARIVGHCPHVRHVTLHWPIFDEIHAVNAVLQARPITTPVVLESLRLSVTIYAPADIWMFNNNGTVMINSIKKLYIPVNDMEGRADFPLRLRRLLNACADTLEELIIEPFQPDEYLPQLLVDLSAMKSLRKLSMQFGVATYVPEEDSGADLYPFDWILCTLKSIPPSANSIQEVILHIIFESSGTNRLSEYTDLMNLLDDSLRFPYLGKLSIRIYTDGHGDLVRQRLDDHFKSLGEQNSTVILELSNMGPYAEESTSAFSPNETWETKLESWPIFLDLI